MIQLWKVNSNPEIGLSKFNDGYGWELIVHLRSNSWAFLQGLGLKFNFHCASHSDIFERSWFKLTVLMVVTYTVENKETPQVKSFGLACKPFAKSFM